MILMHHNIGVQWPDGSLQKRTVGLTVYGDYNGYSAMAKTVGLPTAIAKIQKTNLQRHDITENLPPRPIVSLNIIYIWIVHWVVSFISKFSTRHHICLITFI
jgi:hypothetical protein